MRLLLQPCRHILVLSLTAASLLHQSIALSSSARKGGNHSLAPSTGKGSPHSSGFSKGRSGNQTSVPFIETGGYHSSVPSISKGAHHTSVPSISKGGNHSSVPFVAKSGNRSSVPSASKGSHHSSSPSAVPSISNGGNHSSVSSAKGTTHTLAPTSYNGKRTKGGSRRKLVNASHGNGDNPRVPVHSASYDHSRSVGSRKRSPKGSPKTSVKGSSKGKKGSSPPIDLLNQCEKSCSATNVAGVNHTVSPTEKLSCCRGGVSSLKLIYRGPQRGEFFLPTYEGLSNFTLVDPCGRSGSSQGNVKKGKGGAVKGGRGKGGASKGEDSTLFVKFVSCNRCFPPATSCDPQFDTSENVVVKSGDEICLAAFDEANKLALDGKFPIELELFYLKEGAGTNELNKTTIHTSCSKPVHVPYAVHLGMCTSDDTFFLDLSASGSNATISTPILQFVDGTSPKDPNTLFTNCSDVQAEKASDDKCCKGGASFLKTRFSGTNVSGIITNNASLVSLTPCNHSAFPIAPSGKGGKVGKGKARSRRIETTDRLLTSVRFVSCDDVCLDPVGTQECGTSSDSVQVGPGAEICFGSWDDRISRISHSSKMPPDLVLYFVPDDGSKVVATSLHTSCSTPLHPPFAQTFTDDCNVSFTPTINLNEVPAINLSHHLEFLDGISTEYFQAAQSLHSALSFNINFSNCGCDCGVSPSGEPSFAPNSAPPTGAPVSEPPTGAPVSEPVLSCGEQCEKWIADNCVLVGDDGTLLEDSCDANFSDEISGRFLTTGYVSSVHAAERDVALLSVDEQIQYHNEMAALYKDLLSLLN